MGFTINLSEKFHFTTQRAGKGSAGSALVCLCSELPGILFLNAERRNNTLVLLMLTAIHTPTHNMSIKCLLPPCSYSC